jgi:HK97 family phage prohead protease
MSESITRQVGEKVKLNLHFDKGMTKALGEGEFEAIITTSSLDRHNESIVTEGVDTDNYEKNPVVLYGHDYFGLPIGTTTKLVKMKNKIKATFKLATEEYEFAKTVANLIKAGVLNAVSIGGVVKEWSDDYRTILKMEMVEFSIVAVPANGEAIITGRSFEEATGKTLETVKHEYEQFAEKNMLDKVKGLGDDESNQAIKVLENLLATLKVAATDAATASDETPAEVRRIKRVTVRDAAKAVVTQSHRVVKTIKLSE